MHAYKKDIRHLHYRIEPLFTAAFIFRVNPWHVIDEMHEMLAAAECPSVSSCPQPEMHTRIA